MNIDMFIAKSLVGRQVKKDSIKDIKSLIPPAQKVRSYREIDKTVPKAPITLTPYRVGIQNNKWIKKYITTFPFAPNSAELRRTTTKDQILKYAQEFLLTNSSQFGNDSKYVNIDRSDLHFVIYSWNVDKWMRDAFKYIKPRYIMPITLEFKYKVNIPRFITQDAVESDLKKFIADKFQDFLKRNKSKLFHKNFKFLKRITPDIFEYRTDLSDAVVKASLKYSIILAGLAGYLLFFHKKDAEKKELSKIKTRVRNFGDVKRLDTYLKRLK